MAPFVGESEAYDLGEGSSHFLSACPDGVDVAGLWLEGFAKSPFPDTESNRREANEMETRQKSSSTYLKSTEPVPAQLAVAC